jgi:hypothetical protein
MKRGKIVLLFLFGHCIAVPLALLYLRFSPSNDKYFHSFVMYIAAGWSFPAMITFLRITVDMWDRAVRQEGLMVDLHESIHPLARDGKEAMGSVKALLDRFKSNDISGIEKSMSFLSRLLEGKPDEVVLLKKVVKSTLSDAEGDMEKFIWTRVNGFLGEVFANGESHEKEETSTRGSTAEAEPVSARHRASESPDKVNSDGAGGDC